MRDVTLLSNTTDAYTGTASVTLEPNQSKNVTLWLHPAAPCITNDHLLVTAYSSVDKVYVYPSRSQTQFDPVRKQFSCTVCIMNITPYRYTVSAKKNAT